MCLLCVSVKKKYIFHGIFLFQFIMLLIILILILNVFHLLKQKYENCVCSEERTWRPYGIVYQCQASATNWSTEACVSHFRHIKNSVQVVRLTTCQIMNFDLLLWATRMCGTWHFEVDYISMWDTFAVQRSSVFSLPNPWRDSMRNSELYFSYPLNC